MSDATFGEAFWDSLAHEDPLVGDSFRSHAASRGLGPRDVLSYRRPRDLDAVYQLERLLGPANVRKQCALDFGCGVGRLSQALAKHYESVVGLDISSKMIEHARQLNRRGGRVEYLHNTREDLAILDDARFDLIYSDLVLQHMPSALALGYVREFVRLLSTEGILVFQLPSHPRQRAQPHVTPMTASAYRARIEVSKAPDVWVAGTTEPVHVRVVNDSGELWDQAVVGAIRLGNHWLSPDGTMLIQDDGRAQLPRVLRPGEEAGVTLEVAVPGSGPHILELDVVHEGYSWFADKGSPTLRIAIDTANGPAETQRAATPDAWDEAVLSIAPGTEPTRDVAFPMFAIPRAEVLSFLASQGADTFFIEDDDRGGQEWEGFRYFVRRRRP